MAATEPTTPQRPKPGVISRGTLLRWIGVLLLASLAVSALVGWLAAPSGFRWELAAGAGTAFGTVVLAGFTGALAWTTSGDVRATWELADLTRDEQAARIRPAILVWADGWSTGGDRGQLKIIVVNAGLGPGLHIRIHASVPSPDGDLTASLYKPFQRPAGTDDPTLEFRLSNPQHAFDLASFSLSGTCSDMGQQVSYPIVHLH